MSNAAEDPTSRQQPTRSRHLLDRGRSVLLLVDLQQKLVPVIPSAEAIIKSSCFLLEVAALLQVPVFASEQYPAGLGTTVDDIRQQVPKRTTFDKLRFSAAEEFTDQCRSNPSMASRKQVVLVGIETHICVLQTALDLLSHDFQVAVVKDAVGSRDERDAATALDRLRDQGATVTTAESVAFEWCEVAGSEEFRKISRLVRQRSGSR